jgi:hypothetical protein
MNIDILAKVSMIIALSLKKIRSYQETLSFVPILVTFAHNNFSIFILSFYL